MQNKRIIFIVLLIFTLSSAGLVSADIKKKAPGISKPIVYPDIWVQKMPFSADGLTKGSVAKARFRVFKNTKVNALNWRIDLMVNRSLKKSIYAANTKFIILRNKGGISYCNAVLEYKIPNYGTYKFTCVADSLNQVYEKNKINNSKKFAIHVKAQISINNVKLQVPQTDIILYDAEAELGNLYYDAGFVEGSKFGLNCKWKRVGKAPPVDFVISTYLDGEKMLTGNRGDKDLKSGIVSKGWTATPGYHELRFEVRKPFGDFPEQTLSNNFATVSFYIEEK